MSPSVSLSDRYQALEEVLPEPEVRKTPKKERGSRLGRYLEALLEPISAERRKLNAARWQELPEELRVQQQTMGRSHHSCGATYGVLERCNFACTSCYLSKDANATKALPPERVFEQLDQLRAYLGPKGKAQITAGEVTLLPRPVLGSYVRYAKSIGLDPMVMSHGERLLVDPSYLEALVREDGLGKVSIHVDSTQRGRQGWHQGLKEEDLHTLRSRYADLVRKVRRNTGRRLDAAHTITVTPETLREVPGIVRWLLENADAFRLVSFQPVAEVGRTQDRTGDSMGIPSVWAKICEGLGQDLNRRSMLFGHPECNVVAPMLVLEMGGQRILVEACREGRTWDRAFFDRLIRGFGPFSTIGGEPLRNALALVSLVLRNLPLALEAPVYAAYRLWGLRRRLLSWLPRLHRISSLRVRPFAVIIHKFMGPDEVDTPLGQERLAACVFKLPVQGRMVPMCEMNATDLRSSLTRQSIEGAAKAAPSCASAS